MLYIFKHFSAYALFGVLLQRRKAKSVYFLHRLFLKLILAAKEICMHMKPSDSIESFLDEENDNRITTLDKAHHKQPKTD